MPFFRNKKPEVSTAQSKTTIPFTVIDCPNGCTARVKKSLATGEIERHYRLDKAQLGTEIREVCE